MTAFAAPEVAPASQPPAGRRGSLNKSLLSDTPPASTQRRSNLQDLFLVGLIDGDGCFSVSFLANKRILLGFHITGALTKSQLRLFFRVKRRFDQCGSITRKRGTSSKSYCRYQVDSFRDIKKCIVPFMDQHTLYTEKAIHYAKFKKVVDLIERKAHLNRSGFLEIVEIAYDMNQAGKRRKLTKEEYLQKYCSFDPKL
ncbi:hypothetical protein CLOP_g3591 [Closterium sp. NIES-67]|nr:hypothetical protein CLOP_g3591 [Closterium sp. NIES-67]